MKARNTWAVEYAPQKGAYAPVLVTTRAWDAIAAFDVLQVENGERKRLTRNGEVVDRLVSARSIVTPAGQAVLPIAL